MIYLDSAATAPLDPLVLESMMPYMTVQYGNAGTLYKLGREANAAIQKAREQTARFIGTKPENVIFTSGGSEANNFVFCGLRDSLKEIGKTHILVSAVEHDSVLRTAESLIKEGFYIEYLPVQPDGSVDAAVVEQSLRPETGMVSVMYVNNEVGSVNPIDEIGALCTRNGIWFHTDCVQAAGCFPTHTSKIGCDSLSISAHKIHGPKGIGALYVKDKSRLKPMIYGGQHQEFGMRGGTENVAGIVGLGKACEIAMEYLRSNRTSVSNLKVEFLTTLLNTLKDHGADDCVQVNGPPVLTPGKTLNLKIDGVDGETLILMLDSQDICLSAGSACRSHEASPSHVLTAMGLTPEEARSSVRISFSRMNTSEEIVEAAHGVALAICALR